jgi:hypothetical protein
LPHLVGNFAEEINQMARDRDSVKIVVCPVSGDRLCQDKRWRGFAMFGSYPSCVKEYRLMHAALTAGRRYRHPHNVDRVVAEVVQLNEGDSMNAAGQVNRA